MKRETIIIIAALAATSCASAPPGGARWAANGWLTPGRNGEPELIGIYDTRPACQAAVDGWLSRQVVGNPIHGECLPVDSR